MDLKIEDYLSDEEEVFYYTTLHSSRKSAPVIYLYLTNCRIIWCNEYLGFKSIFLRYVHEISLENVPGGLFSADKIGEGKFVINFGSFSIAFDSKEERKSFYDEVVQQLCKLSIIQKQ